MRISFRRMRLGQFGRHSCPLAQSRLIAADASVGRFGFEGQGPQVFALIAAAAAAAASRRRARGPLRPCDDDLEMTLSQTPAATTDRLTNARPTRDTSSTRLTDADASRVAAALAATHAESSRACYAGAWHRWTQWCDGRELASIPAEPSSLCAYLTERADQGLSVSTLDMACAAIGHQHRHHGLPDPLEHDMVRRVRRGLRRLVGTAPRHPARPLSIEDLRQILLSIDRTTVRGVRDTAVVLLGFAGALRRSELAALTLADLELKPDGLLVHLRCSKTDPERRGQVVGIAHGQHTLTDPITALAAWLTVRGTAPGPVFTSLRPGIQGLQPISGTAVSASSRTAPPPLDLPPSTSPRTPCAPVTPPAPPSPASASSGSSPRPGTAASTSLSSATSAPSRHCRPPPAATSDSDSWWSAVVEENVNR